jgi:hypothetical protein
MFTVLEKYIHKFVVLTVLFVLVIPALPAAAQTNESTLAKSAVPVGAYGGPVATFASITQESKTIPVDGGEQVISGNIRKAAFDRNLNRVTLYVSPGKQNSQKQPWQIFESLNIFVNGYQVRSISTHDQSAWRLAANKNNSPLYAVTVYTGNAKLAANKSESVAVELQTAGGVNGDVWNVWVPKNGITVWSPKTKHVSYGPSQRMQYMVTGEADGAAIIDLVDIKTNVTVSEVGSVGTFTYDLEITANDADVYLPSAPNGLDYVGRPFSDDSFLNFSIMTADGKVLDGYKLEKYAVAIDTTAENVVKDTGGYMYRVAEGETENFRIIITYQPAAGMSGFYRVGLESPLRYSLDRTLHDEDDDAISFTETDFRSKIVFLQAATNDARSVSTTSLSSADGVVCTSGAESFPQGTKRTSVTINGNTSSIMDGYFVCASSGTWQKQGNPARKPAPVASSTAKVLGASTDIYTQMAATITAISRLIDELYR